MKTQELVNAIKANGVKTIGETYINRYGIPYRYEVTKFEDAQGLPKWAASLFRSAALEQTGKAWESIIDYGDMRLIITRGTNKSDVTSCIAINELVKFPN